MALELRPGMWQTILGSVASVGESKAGAAITAVALVIETQAKINASTGAHAYGTATPASPGAGPARISGNLVRALTHTSLETLGPGEFQIKIGTAAGFFPPYGGRKRTPANEYGYYLENGLLRNGAAYPFLIPAFNHGVTMAARLFALEYETGWKRFA